VSLFLKSVELTIRLILIEHFDQS